jgi:hypothetical protein
VRQFEKNIYMPNATNVEKDAADRSLPKIDAPAIISLIVSKQTQYYTLWGGYTAVQFTAGGFGYSYGHTIPAGVGFAMLGGVWAFNLGHLGFVLQCIAQINKLIALLNATLAVGKLDQDSLKAAFKDMQAGAYFWQFYKWNDPHLRSYIMNSFVHFFIDACASVALLTRVDGPLIQNHLPYF